MEQIAEDVRAMAAAASDKAAAEAAEIAAMEEAALKEAKEKEQVRLGYRAGSGWLPQRAESARCGLVDRPASDRTLKTIGVCSASRSSNATLLGNEAWM